MTPKAEKKLRKRRFFDTADRHEKLYGRSRLYASAQGRHETGGVPSLFSRLSFDISIQNSVQRWSSDFQGLFRVKIRKMAQGSDDLSTLPLTSVAKQAKIAFLHGLTVWKPLIVRIEPATFYSESAALTTYTTGAHREEMTDLKNTCFVRDSTLIDVIGIVSKGFVFSELDAVTLWTCQGESCWYDQRTHCTLFLHA